MKTFVDTNIFLRFIDGNDTCIGFIENLKIKKKVFFVQTVVISELIWVLRTSYKWDVSEVADTVESFLNLKSLKFITKCNVESALQMYRAKNVKYNDCLIASIMGKGDQILSFDREFNRFEEIKRIEPKDLIG